MQYSVNKLTVARIGIGLYTALFFLQMIFYPKSLLGIDFFIIDLFPFKLIPVSAASILGLMGSLFFAAGYRVRSAAFVTWVCLVAIICKNSLLREIQFDYLGWMLWLFIFLPKRIRKLPSEFEAAAVFCLGLSYTISGISKFLAPEWNSGEMLTAFFQIGFSRFIPAPTLHVAVIVSAVIATAEALALPMLFYRPTKIFIWSILTLGQIALFAGTRLNHISVVLLFMHILVMEDAWLNGFGLRRKRVDLDLLQSRW
jgi:hypothetical protein